MSLKWIVTEIPPEPGQDSSREEEQVDHSPEVGESSRKKQNGGLENDRAKWISGAWPVNSFDESLPTNKRKAEWFRFRDQFERIVSVKGSVDQETKLTGLKIHAGAYLLNIIDMHEKTIPEPRVEPYDQVIKALNCYFNKTCDTSKERMTFREMRMRLAETFMDWVLRLETQAKFCDFSSDQRQEEFMQALLKRSIPQIGDKLYEMSGIFENNIERIINHGQHLDHIRRESKELEKDKEGSIPMDEPSSINVLRQKSNRTSNQSFNRYERTNRFENKPYRRTATTYYDRRGTDCTRCGEKHAPDHCRAFHVRCHNCEKLGHFAKFCQSSIRKPRFGSSRFDRRDEYDRKDRKDNYDRKPRKDEYDRKDEVKKEINKINQVSCSESD